MVFAPQTRPRIAISSDGTRAAIHEASRITIVELPAAAVVAEFGIEREASASEVAWVGVPPRLVVLTRFVAHSTVQLVEHAAHGARTLAEIRLEAPMRLHATVGSFALAVGSLGVAVLATGDTFIKPYQFPTRTLPLAAGPAGGHFVVALAGSIEEWDPASRTPKRRLRLPRPANITAIGGSERVVWMTTQADPARIEVIALANRGQPKVWDLPEPLAHVTGHPTTDLLACVGAETGKVYLVDLDGRMPLRTLRVDPIDHAEAVGLVAARQIYVIAAQAGRPIIAVSLQGAPLKPEIVAAAPALVAARTVTVDPLDEPTPAKLSSLSDEPAPTLAARPSPTLDAPPRSPPRSVATVAEVYVAPESIAQPVSARPTFARPLQVAEPTAPAVPVVAAATTSLTDRFAARRERQREAQPLPPAMPDAAIAAVAPGVAIAPGAAGAAGAAVAAGAAGAPGAAIAAVARRAQVIAMEPRVAIAAGSQLLDAAPVAAAAEPRSTWRDELVAWARAVGSVVGTASAPPAAPSIEALASRLGLAAALRPALVLAYGAHLGGELGATPIALARVLGERWDEVFGGELVARGVVEHVGARVRLARPLLHALDDLPPLGLMIGEPGEVALLGPCVVIARDVRLVAVAERYRRHVGGAILVGEGPLAREILVEGRARGAVPLVRAVELGPRPLMPDEPAIIVVPDDAIAATLDLPRLE